MRGDAKLARFFSILCARTEGENGELCEGFGNLLDYVWEGVYHSPVNMKREFWEQGTSALTATSGCSEE